MSTRLMTNSGSTRLALPTRLEAIGMRWIASLMCFALAIAFAGDAQSQDGKQKPAAAKPGRPGMPAGRPGKAPGNKRVMPGLPPGHPPIGAPPRPRPRPRMRNRGQAGSAQKLLEKLRRQGRAKPGAKRKRKKYPRDEHGYCVGQGANDRPKDINLVHGWFGVNNEKAVPRPRFAGWDSNASWGDNFKRMWPFWKWRLTPYLYRYENHDDHCDPRNQPVPLLANIINIGALIFLMVWFGRKPMTEALRNRKQSITSEMDKARAIKKSARERLDRYEDDLDHLDDKLAELRDQYALEAANDEKRLREAMLATRDRLLADVDFRLAQADKGARDALSREALESAMSAAEQLLVDNLKDSDHDRLEAEYLDHIGGMLASSDGSGTDGGVA